jgi:hypothetical protein
MDGSNKYVDDFLNEMDDKIYQQEDDLYNQFEDYFYDFDTDNSRIEQSANNFSRANKVNDEFSKAFAAYIAGFLIWYGNKVIGVQPFVVSYYNSMGFKAKLSDVDFLKKQIGIDGSNIIKDSYLWNLGFMGEFRQKVQNYIINSIASAKRFNAFLRDAKPLFKSTAEQPSSLMNFYRKYAYDTANQMLNVTGNFFADKFGLNEFLYEGDLIKDSREFCIERCGNTYTREEGESWNDLQWSGKIPGVDFFIQAGGTNCRHLIVWQNNK